MRNIYVISVMSFFFLFTKDVASQVFTLNELEMGLSYNFPKDIITTVTNKEFLRSYDQDFGGFYAKENVLVENEISIISTFITGGINGNQIWVSYMEKYKPDFEATKYFLSKTYPREKEFIDKKGKAVQIYASTNGNYFAITNHHTAAYELYFDLYIMD